MENKELLEVPVVVCGVDEEGNVTEKGSGFQEFTNIIEAQKKFPDLDISNHTTRFTSAMKEEKEGKIIKLRFETWKANDVYSR